MSTAELKASLQNLIEKEQDTRVLQAILTLLEKTSLDPALKEKLTSRALKSEEDINTGRLYSKEEVKSQIHSHLNEVI